MSYYLVLVGTTDSPLYESFLTSTGSYLASTANTSSASTIISVPLPTTSNSFSIFGNLPATSNGNAKGTGGASTVGYGHKNSQQGRHVMQLVAHASLDVVEDVQWSNGGMLVLLSLASPHLLARRNDGDDATA